MLCRRHFDVNCMVLIAAVGALALQDYPDSAAVAFLFSIGETLESWASFRARDAFSLIPSPGTTRANVVNPLTDEAVVLPTSDVPVGSLVRVGPGETVPCDGVVREGRSATDASSPVARAAVPSTLAAGRWRTAAATRRG